MDFSTRNVHILLLCFCLGHVANGNILDTMRNILWKFMGNAIIEYDDQTHVQRRFINQPDSKATTATWGVWTSDSVCSKTCGDGFKEYIRKCSTGSYHDCEKDGGQYWKIDHCNDQPCGAHWTAWHVTKACSVTCGTGVQVRQRSCSSGKAADCPGKYYEFGTCTPGPCSTSTTTQAPTTSYVAPVWSAWSSEKSCSVTCGTGFTEKTRTCSTGNSRDCGGNPWQVIPCTPRSCLIDGVWDQWSTWSACTATCGPSQRSRSRTCNYQDPANKGAACSGDATQTEDCSTSACAVDGTWEPWGAYSSCSASCGSGFMFRSRGCSYPPGVPHGKACVGDDFDTNTCMKQQCAVDGTWSTWSAWSNCAKSCGDGYQFRNRFCAYESGKPHGKACAGSDIDMQQCTKGLCPVDGHLSEWTAWSQCSNTCNGGTQARTRVCTFDAKAPHGKDCTGALSENQDCGQQECAVDGTWADWQGWAQCTSTCGGGSTVRNRVCEYKSPTAPHGKVCPGESFEKKNCSDSPCAVDGTWATWTKFTDCSVTCGTGQQFRTRTCKFDDTAPRGLNCSGASKENKECHKKGCPVDGTLTEWGAWSFCTKTCESGTQVRSRDCFFPANVSHGADCTGALTETVPCNDSPCPTTTTMMMTTTTAVANGSWSAWGNFSACTLTCGSGTQTRTRTCTYPDHTLHGQFCPDGNNDTQPCNTEHCPMDGTWSQWSLFGKCSASCENGTHTKTRTCSFDTRYPKGANCTGNSTSTESCYAGACPVDGDWGTWGTWSTCPVTCGGGLQDRVRICEYAGTPHGDPCPGESHDNRTCGDEKCPVDGVLSQWSTWTDCPVTCGNGTHTRNRSCDFPAGARHGADCIGKLYQAQSCNDNLCPVDGLLTQWSGWSRCSKSCGGGTQPRTRSCQYDQHAPHGKPCVGATSETQDCNTQKCPVDGVWGAWAAYSTCSATCEDGTHTRMRTCNYLPPGSPHGKECSGEGNQTEACNNGPCPVNGTWSSWADWSSCSLSCGNGTKSRDRTCDFPVGVPRGANCTGDDTEQIACNTTLCPVDGSFGNWSAWTTCPVTCGGGVISRHRSCEFDPVAPPGENCTGDFTQTQNCSTNNCPVDGTWGAWSDYTNCSVTCGNGTSFRKRKCEFQDGYPHGNNCSGDSTESKSCNPNLCPVDGQFSVWAVWSDCSKSCENGTQTRARTCEFDTKAPRGADCVGSLTENQPCNVDKCPINSQWSNWTDFSACSETCGNGTYTRTRTCISHDPHPSSQCYGPNNETKDCSDGPCAVDGTWSDWTGWSTCSVSCDGGKQSRGRICEFPPNVPKGANCTGDGHEIADCGTGPCPVDGVLSAWSDWSNCSVTCSDGVQFRTRKCDYKDGHPHGADCNATLNDQTACHNSPCAVDGVWSAWGSWGTCDATCGNGTKIRARTCDFKPAGAPKGADCVGAANDTASCNEKPCPVDGTWAQWSDYSACTKSCGNGTATRTRTCEFADPAPHGSDCIGDASEMIRCNETECREDGVWSSWSAYTSCSVTCGDGNKTRSRTCTYPTSVHGDPCPGDSTETDMCNQTLCAVDGTWKSWNSWSTCSETCGDGVWSRTRDCGYDAVAPHGKSCPGSKSQQVNCKVAECTVDGVWTSWTPWSVCSQTCENGTETRTRNCGFTPPGAPRGKNCTGDNQESQVCTNPQDCPADGTWGDWAAWSSCSATCGAVTKLRSRDCEFDPAKPRGNDCFGAANATADCGFDACPVDGKWGQWQDWSVCSVTCGTDGVRNRVRTCMYQSNVPHGKDCTGDANQSEKCGPGNQCPVGGFWEEWGRWRHCTVTCGGGTRSRSRVCSFPPHVIQGQYCEGSGRDNDNCNEQPCA